MATTPGCKDIPRKPLHIISKQTVILDIYRVSVRKPLSKDLVPDGVFGCPGHPVISHPEPEQERWFPYNLPQKKRTWSSFSFEEECRTVNLGPKVISTMLPVTICQNPHSTMTQNYHSLITHLQWCASPASPSQVQVHLALHQVKSIFEKKIGLILSPCQVQVQIGTCTSFSKKPHSKMPHWLWISHTHNTFENKSL